jgi:hypothetical protein
VNVQSPEPSAVVVPATVPSIVTVTVEFGSAVPVIAGVGSFVDEPAAGAVITGAAGAAVSTVNVSGADAGDTLPTPSVAVAVAVCGPSARGAVGVNVQSPNGPAVAVPATAPSIETVTVEFGSAVPVIAGVGSFVDEPSAGAVITGAAGAVVSTVNVSGADAGDSFPAAAVAVAVAVCGPSLSGAAGVNAHAPELWACAVPATDPSIVTVTVESGSAVPEIAGVVSFVDEPFAGAVITGASGAVVSTVKESGVDAGDTFPAASVAVAVAECGPSPSGVVGVNVQSPSGLVVAVPTTAPSIDTVTVEFGSAVPEMAGVASAVVDPSAGAVITGAAGTTVSTVK